MERKKVLVVDDEENVRRLVRRMLGKKNIVLEAEDGEMGRSTIAVGDTKLIATTDLRGKVHLSLRPEDILLSKEPLRSTARNSLPGVVTDVADRGAVIYVTVTVPPDFISLITRQSFEELELKKGVRVWVTFKASAIHVF